MTAFCYTMLQRFERACKFGSVRGLHSRTFTWFSSTTSSPLSDFFACPGVSQTAFAPSRCWPSDLTQSNLRDGVGLPLCRVHLTSSTLCPACNGTTDCDTTILRPTLILRLPPRSQDLCELSS